MGVGGTGRGPFAVAIWRLAVGTVDGMRRRRSRQGIPRPRPVQFSLSEEEFAEVSEAAARSGLARGAFAAEAALATARGTQGSGVAAVAGCVSGADVGGRVGAPCGDEFESGGGAAECDGGSGARTWCLLPSSVRG